MYDPRSVYICHQPRELPLLHRAVKTYTPRTVYESHELCMIHDLCICVVSRESCLYCTAPFKHIRHKLYTRVTNYAYLHDRCMCRQPRELPCLHRAVRTCTPRTVYESHELCICCPICVYVSSAATATFFTRGGGLGLSTIFKKFNEPYAPS